MNKTLIIILNYNGWQDTKRCVESLDHQTDKNFDIYLIDNASLDESFDELQKIQRSNLILTRTEFNFGFTGGVNHGIKYAMKKNYARVALLNNDALLDKNWLAKLVQVLDQKPDCGMATGLMLTGDGKRIDSAGDSCTWWGMPFPRFRDQTARKAPEAGYVLGATGGASIYRTKLFEEIGLFDEHFFVYFEDSDISMRAQLAGFKCFYEPSAVCYHNHGTTSAKIKGLTVYHSFKNLPMFMIKTFPMSLLLRGLWFFLIKRNLAYVKAVFTGSFFPATRGSFNFIKFLPKILNERRKIQKNRQVSVKYIRDLLSSKRY